MTNLSLIEDLAGQFGGPFVSGGNLTVVTGPSDPASSIAINGAFDGDSDQQLIDTSAANMLAVGDSFIIEFTATVNALELNGPLENQVTGSAVGVDSNGNRLLDENGNELMADDLSDNGLSLIHI